MNGEAASLLELPVEIAVGSIVDSHLADARSALDRMKDRRDREALHDFRVAVRRLRSVLRAYRRWLGRAAGRKILRRLRRLGAATNAGRDAEVQIEWLEAQRRTLLRGERSGLDWLLKRRRAARRAGYEGARRRGREDLSWIADRIARGRSELVPGSAILRDVVVPLLREHAAALESSIVDIRGPEDVAAVHAARIRAKRLRYLVEPLETDVAGVNGVLKSLKAMQDELGRLHDLHVLEVELGKEIGDVAPAKAHRRRDPAPTPDRAGTSRERGRDEKPGLAMLTARVRTSRAELFAELQRRWIGEGAPALLHDVRALADALAPKSVPTECERKYLLLALPGRAREAPMLEIEQGWLPGRALRERLRRVKGADGERFYRTVKLGSGIERIEIEEETTAAVFAAMWPLTEGCRIAKRRYCVVEGARTWEVDQFLDRDLVLAEIELASADEAVAIPDWLAGVLLREVTGDPEYLNLTLATRSVPAVP